MASAHSAINGTVALQATSRQAHLTAIAGATGLTYLLVEADEDSYIAVEATFTDGSGTEESLASAASTAQITARPANQVATGTPTIVGHPRVGEQTGGRRVANN